MDINLILFIEAKLALIVAVWALIEIRATKNSTHQVVLPNFDQGEENPVELGMDHNNMSPFEEKGNEEVNKALDMDNI